MNLVARFLRPLDNQGMTAYRAIVVEPKDLIVVTVTCDECGAEVSVNSESGNVSNGCPSCGRDYGENVANALAALGRFHRSARMAATQSGKPVFRFNIKQVD